MLITKRQQQHLQLLMSVSVLSTDQNQCLQAMFSHAKMCASLLKHVLLVCTEVCPCTCQQAECFFVGACVLQLNVQWTMCAGICIYAEVDWTHTGLFHEQVKQ